MNEINVLLSTAIFIGVVHTLIGVDHYVPFVVLSKANAWSMRKTMGIVLICGIGHVLSSALFGLLGILMSQSLSFLVNIESIRGTLATYFMIVFGFIYTGISLRNMYKNKPHTHKINGEIITHDHHHIESVDDHHQAKPKSNLNLIWGLFILFVLGPCEPLIPLLMFPAATQNTLALIEVTTAFSVCTILSMMAMTYIGVKGIKAIQLKSLEKFAHPMAGLAITLCGVMILTLGI